MFKAFGNQAAEVATQQIEDAAEAPRQVGILPDPVEMSTSPLRHRVLPNMEPGKMKTNLKGGFGGAWSFCSLGDLLKKRAQISCKTMKGSC